MAEDKANVDQNCTAKFQDFFFFFKPNNLSVIVAVEKQS